MDLKRLQIMGPPGSGKSTLAEAAAGRIGARYVDLDPLFWGPNWTPRPDEVFRAAVDAATAEDAWVIGANYSRVRDLVWGRAQAVVWLDLPLALVLRRLLSRTVKRVVTGEELWNGNRETWRAAFFSRESLFPFSVRQHGQFRRELPALLAAPEWRHLKVWRLRSAAHVAGWLEELVVEY